MATAAVQQPTDAAAGAVPSLQQQDLTVQLNKLQFSYPGCDKFLKGVSLDLPKGSRTLLLGANGAGKTTLLQLIAGKYMVGRETIRVLQQSPFYDMVSICMVVFWLASAMAAASGHVVCSWRQDMFQRFSTW